MINPIETRSVETILETFKIQSCPCPLIGSDGTADHSDPSDIISEDSYRKEYIRFCKNHTQNLLDVFEKWSTVFEGKDSYWRLIKLR
jgi:hypothetical protein